MMARFNLLDRPIHWRWSSFPIAMFASTDTGRIGVEVRNRLAGLVPGAIIVDVFYQRSQGSVDVFTSHTSYAMIGPREKIPYEVQAYLKPIGMRTISATEPVALMPEKVKTWRDRAIEDPML